MEVEENANMETELYSIVETKVYPKLETKVSPDLEAKVYPNLEKMCRLCLKENGGTVCIFSREKTSDKYATLSIPMRIMTCAALEVQDSDGFPKKICGECRLQLEKSYYFRKMSQAADAKLRKHLRFVQMGKTSEVFNKFLQGDDDDQPEFQHSLDFIKEEEDKQKLLEKSKMDSLLNKVKFAYKLKYEQEQKEMKETLKEKCREELIPILREEMRQELRTEIQIDLEENLRKEITEQCIDQAKESLRSEIREECRRLEIKRLLDDLQVYLINKKSVDGAILTKDISLKRPFSPVATKEVSSKQKCIANNSQKIEERMEYEIHDGDVEKDTILSENKKDDDVNMNDDDCDSESNFLIYDIDESSDADVKKKPIENKLEFEEHVEPAEEYEDEELTESNIITYENIDENIYTNDECGETTSKTSYHIEDNEDGEIQFLKKTNDNNNVIDEECSDSPNESIMVINIAGAENVFVENFEKMHMKTRKQMPTKTKKSPEQKAAQTSAVNKITSSTSETTFLTKTYVNPLQRSTYTAKIFKCDDCPMVFSTKPSLERHLRTHRKVEKTGIKFQCPECRIVVSCSSALRRHMYVHCDEKPFSCTVCEKSFVQKEILKRHMQTHTGIKPHQCPHCERSFAQRINLTQHINRTHLEEPRIEQHPCHLCPKTFNYASGLSRHLASHSGVAFQCSECGGTFGDRSSIKRHIISIHGNARISKSDADAKTCDT